MSSVLTGRQQIIKERVFGVGAPRPSYDPGFAGALRDRIEDALRDESLPDGMWMGKSPLERIHQCEAYYLAQRERFEMSVPLILGKVAHRMVQIFLGAGTEPPSLEMADRVVERMLDPASKFEQADAEYLSRLTVAELADVKTGATNAAVQFSIDWPSEARRWKPRIEHRVGVDLLGGRLRLSGTADLIFGAPDGREARAIIVDMKTGGMRPGHIEALRFYALLITLRDSVPPFRVASYYLQEGDVHAENVSAETLETAVRRLIDGVRRIVALESREASRSPGRHCWWCSASADCQPGSAFLRDARGEDPI